MQLRFSLGYFEISKYFLGKIEIIFALENRLRKSDYIANFSMFVHQNCQITKTNV